MKHPEPVQKKNLKEEGCQKSSKGFQGILRVFIRNSGGIEVFFMGPSLNDPESSETPLDPPCYTIKRPLAHFKSGATPIRLSWKKSLRSFETLLTPSRGAFFFFL